MPDTPRKLILTNFLSPGDIVVLTAAVRDLHRTYPGQFLTDVRTSCRELWENNPHITPIDDKDAQAQTIECKYPLVHYSNQRPYHFIHGFIHHLNRELRLAIRPSEFRGDIHMSEDERASPSQVQEIAGQDIPFWIIVSGGKLDYTIKWWDPTRYQRVVDQFLGKILFVQVGAKHHHHPPLKRVLDLRGKTTLRQLVRLVYHAQGVLCPVTALMHMAAAVPTKTGMPINRACVVIAGGREPPHWEAYPRHQFIHTVGMLPCCGKGGCWKSRTVPLGDGDEKDEPKWLCTTRTRGNMPRCMAMISAGDVIGRIRGYYRGRSLRYLAKDEIQKICCAGIWEESDLTKSQIVRNDVEMRVFGMRRSGNHSVINWLASLFPGKVCFLNDLTHNHMPGPHEACGDLPGLPSERRASLHEPKRLLLYSFEDVSIEGFSRFWMPRQMTGCSGRRATILILRDPLNMFASRLKLHRDRPKNSFAAQMLLGNGDGASQLTNCWLQYAREFAGETCCLGERLVRINYNWWIVDEAYRREICQQVGGEYREDTLGQVPEYGFGSSFDGRQHGRLQNRQGLLTRWKHFQGDPQFENLVSCPELRRLANVIFGEIGPAPHGDPPAL